MIEKSGNAAPSVKGKMSGTRQSTVLRKSLVVFQFAASLFLLIGTFTVYRHPEKVHMQVQKAAVNPVQDGFSQIMQVSAKIRETLRLKFAIA